MESRCCVVDISLGGSLFDLLLLLAFAIWVALLVVHDTRRLIVLASRKIARTLSRDVFVQSKTIFESNVFMQIKDIDTSDLVTCTLPSYRVTAGRYRTPTHATQLQRQTAQSLVSIAKELLKLISYDTTVVRKCANHVAVCRRRDWQPHECSVGGLV
jgi:hypothetical protein